MELRKLFRMPSLGTICLILLAIGVAAGAANRHRARRPVARSAPSLQPIPDSVDVVSGGRRLGGDDASIVLVVFSDYQCPFCTMAAKQLERMRRDSNGSLAVVYRHYPLRRHPHALNAAIAAECAADQNRFEAYHHSLFEHQDSIGVSDWSRFAILAGIPDIEAFRQCVREEQPRVRVERDVALGRAIAVEGTPTYVLGRHKFTGTWSPAQWAKILSQLTSDR